MSSQTTETKANWRTRAAIVLISGIVIAALLWTFLPRSLGDSRPVLKVGSQRGGAKAMMEAAGVLDDLPYRIEWSEFPAAQTLLEAIGAGAVDVGAVGDAPFLFSYGGGAPIKAISVVQSDADGSLNAILVPKNSPIRTVADLKGKKIATGKVSVGHYTVLRLLDQAGLKPSDVTITFLSPGDSRAAFSSGAVDAWATWSSYIGAALLHGDARVLADSRGLMTGQSFQAASETAIATKRPQLQDFVQRLDKAQAWAMKNPDIYGKALAEETGLPLDVAKYVTDRQKLRTVPIDTALIEEERTVLDHFVRAGALKTDRKLEDAFDPSFNR